MLVEEIFYTQEVIDRIIDDLDTTPLLFVGEKGSGKSSSMKTLLLRALARKNIILKIFDTSLNWYRISPTKHRISVTDLSEKIPNLEDCTYDIKLLSEDDRIAFVSSVVKADTKERYDFIMSHIDDEANMWDNLPMIIYVFEEADSYLSTNTLNSGKKEFGSMRDLMKDGRNYRQNVISIATSLVEVDISVRKRSNILLSRMIGNSELNVLKNRTNDIVKQLSKTLPKYNFIYFNRDGETLPFNIKDECQNKPINYQIEEMEAEITPSIKLVEIKERALSSDDLPSLKNSNKNKKLIIWLLGFLIMDILFLYYTTRVEYLSVAFVNLIHIVSSDIIWILKNLMKKMLQNKMLVMWGIAFAILGIIVKFGDKLGINVDEFGNRPERRYEYEN